MTQTGADHRG